MNVPDIDLEKLKRFKEKNFKERLAFIDFYVDWMKKHPNKKWSQEQKNLIG